MKRAVLMTLAGLGWLALAAGAAKAADSACITCHEKVSPGIVADWKKSAMSDAMGCEQCHGDAHQGGEDAPKAAMPTAETCQKCHKDANANFPNAWLFHYKPTLSKFPLIFMVDTVYRIFIPIMVIGLIMQVLLHIWRYAVNR